MGLFGRLFGAGKKDSGIVEDRDGLHVYVACARCGEKIHIRANRITDVAQDYDDDGNAAGRMLHKEILGSRCQNLMFVHLTLDAAYHVTEAVTDRCTMISREEYEASTGS